MTRYDVQLTIHAAQNLPVADFSTLSCDPYVLAKFLVPGSDQLPLTFRTPTVRRNKDPTWDAVWLLSGVPASGFRLELKVIDEDTTNRDDRMGKAYAHFTNLVQGFQTSRAQYEIKKRKGSFRPWIQTYVASLIPGQKLRRHHYVVLSVKVTGKSDDQNERRVYTNGPNKFSRHFSPLIGKMVHKSGAGSLEDSKECEAQHISSSAFIATKLQLAGPVPAELRHHWVGYRPFIEYLFRQTGIRGRLLHFALHRQYRSIYRYNKSTVYGVVDVAWAQSRGAVSVEDALAREFLDMTSWGEAEKIFTYVVTLDGEWRFTETGDEFAINMLTKHSMHADVAPVVAFSGEFFVQKCPDAPGQNGDALHGASESDGHTSSSSAQPTPDERNPKAYELIIDNDSGTYRPNPSLLPLFASWLSAPSRLGGLGRVRAMDESEEELKELKAGRREEKKKRAERGQQPQRAAMAVNAPSMLPSIGHVGTGIRSISSGKIGTRGISSAEVTEVIQRDKQEEANGLVPTENVTHGEKTT